MLVTALNSTNQDASFMKMNNGTRSIVFVSRLVCPSCGLAISVGNSGKNNGVVCAHVICNLRSDPPAID